MKSRVNKKVFMEQMSFISELTHRLAKDINYEVVNEEETMVHTLNNHSRMQHDITKIRRELQQLAKMLTW